MQDEAFLTVMRVWAATAWADGVIADSERRLLDGLIRNAPVSQELKETALSYLTDKTELEDARVDRLTPQERAGVYRAACGMATVDRRLTESEKEFLSRLAARLGLEDDAAAAIRSEYLRPVEAGD